MTQHTYDVETVVVHGHKRAYVKVGQGPALLLLHGLGCDHHTWDPVLTQLSRHFTVIAPDLLGHGRSDKPRGDYSVAGNANGMRDLLTVLGIDKVTVVGHSLGGGVAMQFAYQFPERTERLCLVAPGGMGPEVSVLLRALTLPGAGLAVGALTTGPARHLGRSALHALSRTRLACFRDASELGDIYARLADPATRTALRHVTRGVIDVRGQIVTMTDRAYLTEHMPMCVVWGADDTIIPSHHADIARRHAPAARVEVLPDSGHFPHKDHPERFAEILRDFTTQTAPATYHRGRWRAVLRRGPAAPTLEAVETA
ncbi:MAG TPA: alpha/beta fold hydrolase [Nocardioidaceae bacterium]|nr:alpha/beta fold hydrolase [Nocardioidaceae bacterium]